MPFGWAETRKFSREQYLLHTAKLDQLRKYPDTAMTRMRVEYFPSATAIQKAMEKKCEEFLFFSGCDTTRCLWLVRCTAARVFLCE